MSFKADFIKQGMEGAIDALKRLPDPFATKLVKSDEAMKQSFNHESSQSLAPAHRIEQGGIGFSADEPIGTEHVGNCVAVIARDPATGKTGLAHYDAVSTPESLQRLFNSMPDRKLDVVLVGAMYDKDTVGKDYLRDTSQSNLNDVMQFLSGKNVNMVGARVHDPNQPTNFVIDPKDFSFHTTSPDIPNPDQGLAFARKFLTGERQPMAVEFDLTESKNRYPYLFDQKQVDNLNTHVRGKSRKDVAGWHKSLGARGGFENIQADLTLGTYLPAYEKSVGLVAKLLGGEAVARSRPLYVGENADDANQKILLSLDTKGILPPHGLSAPSQHM